MKIFRFLGTCCVVSLVLAAGCTASVVTGVYVTGDQATQSGSSFNLTATPSTDSYVLFYPNQTYTFAQLTSLSANFVSLLGGDGGGSPRLRILLDADFDNDPVPGDNDGNDASISIYLGQSPGYSDSDAVLNTYSGVNLIGNNDPGRYDTSGMPTGGSPFTTYADALAKYGNMTVLRYGYVLDTYSNPRSETLNSINVTAEAPTPEPATWGLFGFGIIALRAFRRSVRAN